MEKLKVRLVAALAELLAVAALTLLVINTVRGGGTAYGPWGVTAAVGSATAVACAMIMCATGKVLAQRPQRRLSESVEGYLKERQL